MTYPEMSAIESRNHHTFMALMWALAHPGRVHILPDPGLRAFADIAAALVDLETSYYTPHAELDRLIAPLGARMRPPATALYQFYPELRAEDLPALAEAPIGAYAYPDESATLVIGCSLQSGVGLRLSGPGIDGSISLMAGGMPPGFWALRERTIRYPLGWDVFLVANDWVVGLPRTTQVEGF